MVGHHQDADAARRQFAQRLAQFPGGAQIEAGGGLVEHQRLRIVHQGARDQDAARLAARHLIGIALRQVGDFEQLHHLARLLFHGGRDRVMRPDADAAEEAREHDFVARVVARAHLHPVVGDDAENVAQVEEAPLVAPQNAHAPGLVLEHRVQVARDQFDERRFAAPVGAEDGGVLALRDVQGDRVQGDALVAAHRDVVQFDERDQASILGPTSGATAPAHRARAAPVRAPACRWRGWSSSGTGRRRAPRRRRDSACLP